MRNRPLSESIGKIKAAERELGFLPFNKREEGIIKLQSLIEEKKLVEKKFEDELRIIYGATLLSSDPSGLLKYIENYPVFERDGDKVAAVSALKDISHAMTYGSTALKHLISRNKPINEKGFLSSLVSEVFPLIGGKVLTFFHIVTVRLHFFLKSF